MDYLPTDPAILVSSVNMLLRDEEFDSLESLCYAFSCEPAELRGYLLLQGFVYSLQQKQFRPIGYDDDAVQSSVSTPVTRDSVETAYSFLHQKRNVYVHSTLDWQRDDIEYAIGNFADDIHPLLLDVLADGRSDFLHDHRQFLSDITQAVERLATLLWYLRHQTFPKA